MVEHNCLISTYVSSDVYEFIQNERGRENTSKYVRELLTAYKEMVENREIQYDPNSN